MLWAGREILWKVHKKRGGNLVKYGLTTKIAICYNVVTVF